MNEQEYRQTFKEDQAVGWEAIDAALKALYGDVKPRSYGPIIKYWLGGTDPLDNSDIFDCEEQTFHRHIVSYGMSELYFNPELAGADYSNGDLNLPSALPLTIRIQIPTTTPNTSLIGQSI